jgi:raffinose/stachyose/melibiose transport system substrate-binding protein
MSRKPRGHTSSAIASIAVATLLLAACAVGGGDDDSAGGKVTLTFLTGDDDQILIPSKAVAEAFMRENPDVEIDIETQPGGSEGDNLIKTRLATGEMSDVFLYNSGSLFQALNPEQTLTPLTDEPWISDIHEGFLASTTAGDEYYGAPIGSAGAGGFLYNRGVYKDLGLEVPKTWGEFMANNERIEQAGIDPVMGTYVDTWTAQIVMLADFHNILAQDPEWADKYTANEAKYQDEPAVSSFEKLAELHDQGYMNKDFASSRLDEGLERVASGEAAHYPALSLSIGQMVNNYPESAEGVGFFPIPGDDPSTNGFTAWMANAIYIPNTTTGDDLDAALRFLEFVASPDGCNAQTKASPPTGPYMVQSCTLPQDLPVAVEDMLPYFADENGTSPALEFLSPVKGPALEQICVEVGSGIRSAEDGAALYDEDVEKQAQQLGLEGW